MRGVASSLLVVATASACSLFVDASGLSGADDPAVVLTGDDAGAEASSPPPPGPDASPRDPDLVGEWLFDELGAAIARDTSGNGFDARLTGTASLSPGGFRGAALSLAGGGSTAVVDALADGAFPVTGTLSLHFRATFNPNDEVNRAVFDEYSRTRDHLFLRRPNDGRETEMQYGLQPSSAGYSAVADFTLEPEAWMHVVMTWDAGRGEATLFVDKREIARVPYSGAFTPQHQRFVLGRDWVGEIDEVRLWRRALTPTEIVAID